MKSVTAAAFVALSTLAFLAWGATAANPALHFSPTRAPVGAEVSGTAKGLPPETDVTLVWHTAEPEWVMEKGAYFKGFRAPAKKTPLLTFESDAEGNAKFTFTVPEDFGRLHNTTLESDGEVLARQGFLVKPTVTVEPASGPPGTSIHVTMHGLAYGAYSFMYGLHYDHRTTGTVTAISTHGTAEMVITAVGPPGPHGIRLVPNAFGHAYLNTQQSPVNIPGISDPLYATFTVTEGTAVTPPAPATQGLPREVNSGARVSAQTEPRIWTDYRTGHVGDPLVVQGSGFPAGSEVTLLWQTVVGNRISGEGWQTQDSTLANARTDAKGDFRWEGATPDDLGGAHRITAEAGDVQAWTTYAITPNLVSFGPREVAPGEQIRIELKGIGWTETENIITVVHDNSYIGYSCGFNSQGRVTILLPASQRPGWHFIDLYPAIYKGDMGRNPAFPFRLPMLNVADHPNVPLPAFHVAYKVKAE